jgi:cyclopropane-fatty-acyl-phospholipid synthase
MLQKLQHGRLHLRLPDGSESVYGHSEQPSASLVVHDWAVFAQAMRHGDIGFAESFIAGEWETPDLCALLRVFIANRRALEDVIYGRWWGQLAHRLRHWLNRNTRSNSRKNIHAHYDLGNAFYSLWLDKTMNYSSAWFDGNPMQDMAQAQEAKVRRALRMVNLTPGHKQRLLEIGCGWGALAEISTREWGVDYTGVTLSEQQLQHAQQRLADQGMGTQTQFRLQDYRDIDDAAFDAICSIEMVEAVGQAYWPTYFQTVARLLKPGVRACGPAPTALRRQMVSPDSRQRPTPGLSPGHPPRRVRSKRAPACLCLRGEFHPRCPSHPAPAASHPRWQGQTIPSARGANRPYRHAAGPH